MTVNNNNTTNFFYLKERHRFHLVDNSQLPVMTAISTYLLASSFVFYLHPTKSQFISIIDHFLMQFAVIFLTAVLFSWFVTVVIESGKGHHTAQVRYGLRLGMILFIVSEAMLFFSFFWAFFHVSSSPSIALGCVWPPASMQPLDFWGIPLYNTILLLLSGLTLTVAHRYLLQATDNHAFTAVRNFLFLTIALGSTFLFLQFVEYKYGITFSWSDNVFGSIFYVTTGFHGFHVVVGTIFLMFCLIRLVITSIDLDKVSNQYKPMVQYLSLFSFRKEQHIGFEAAAWYWHFVDVVWIFLFITIYWWNSASIDLTSQQELAQTFLSAKH